MVRYNVLVRVFFGIFASFVSGSYTFAYAEEAPAPFAPWDAYQKSPVIGLTEALKNTLKSGEMPAHIREFLLENPHVLPETYMVKPLNTKQKQTVMSDSPQHLPGFKKMQKLDMATVPSMSIPSTSLGMPRMSLVPSDKPSGTGGTSLPPLGSPLGTDVLPSLLPPGVLPSGIPAGILPPGILPAGVLPVSKPSDASSPTSNMPNFPSLEMTKGNAKQGKDPEIKKSTLLHESELVEAREKITYFETKLMAEKNNPKAQMELGMLYFEGKNRDIEQAVFWLQKAIDNKYLPAYNHMGLLEEKGHIGAVNLTNAAKWYEEAAVAGDDEGAYRLALLYDTGKLEQNRAVAKQKAMEYYRMAAEHDHIDSLYRLAVFYVRGEFIQQNKDVASAFYRRAANLGHAISQVQMGRMYEKGISFPADSSLAAAWYSKAALQDLASAQYFLAGMYRKGEGVSQDSKKAFELYTLSANQGFLDAQFDLGILYLVAKDEMKSEANGIKWLEKAAAQGDKQAKNMLVNLKAKNTLKVKGVM